MGGRGHGSLLFVIDRRAVAILFSLLASGNWLVALNCVVTWPSFIARCHDNKTR
jgi:hypothetical protein